MPSKTVVSVTALKTTSKCSGLKHTFAISLDSGCEPAGPPGGAGCVVCAEGSQPHPGGQSGRFGLSSHHAPQGLIIQDSLSGALGLQREDKVQCADVFFSLGCIKSSMSRSKSWPGQQQCQVGGPPKGMGTGWPLSLGRRWSPSCTPSCRGVGVRGHGEAALHTSV